MLPLSFLVRVCGGKSLITTFCLASSNPASVKTHFTAFPSSKSSDRLVLCDVKLILPWKCKLESWLSDHCARWLRNLRLCCSLFEVSRRGFVAGEGGIESLCFGGVCIIEALGPATDIVFSAPEEELGRVIVNRSNSAASDEFVQPNIGATPDTRRGQRASLVTHAMCLGIQRTPREWTL
jgi:hypothetical protein